MEVNITQSDALRLMQRVEKPQVTPDLKGFDLHHEAAKFSLVVSDSAPDPDLRVTLHANGSWTATVDIYLNE